MARSLRVLENRNRKTLGTRHGWKAKVCQARFGWPTAFVAETYGWLTGRPAVCISALGPGAFNFCFISSHSLAVVSAPPRDPDDEEIVATE
jgi:hypothetical protein